MGERVLKLVERRMTSKLFLQVSSGCQKPSERLFAETPGEARLSLRLLSWLEQHSVGHVPSPVHLAAQPLTMSGQGMRTRIAVERSIQDETSLALRLLEHDQQESTSEDPESSGFILVADGSPNLLPVGANLAINICRIGHFLHIPQHWDADLIKIDDRHGNWAHANLITVERRH